MVGRVELERGLGLETGTLEIVVRNGKRHAYVTTDGGQRVHVPFAPDSARSRNADGRLALGVKEDRSSGDLVRSTWSLREVAK